MISVPCLWNQVHEGPALTSTCDVRLGLILSDVGHNKTLVCVCIDVITQGLTGHRHLLDGTWLRDGRMDPVPFLMVR